MDRSGSEAAAILRFSFFAPPPGPPQQASSAAHDRHASRPLVLLITPTDRHRDTERLTHAGLRVIATSAAESSARQIMEAQPAVIAIELVPSVTQDAIRLLSEVQATSRMRRVPLLVYGDPTSSGIEQQIERAGARWVPLPDANRDALLREVEYALAGE